jgi:polysaccharide export outer membrane protein
MKSSLQTFWLGVFIAVCTLTSMSAQAPGAPASEPSAPVVALPEITAPALPPPETLQPPPVKKGGATPAAAPGSTTGAQAEQPHAVPGSADAKPYVIGPLDMLYVKVWNNPNLTGVVNVGPDGMIGLALIGQLKADGLTASQLTDVLKTKLSDWLENPEVSVDVSRVLSKKFYITGGVNRPGPYPLTGKTTVFEALTSAGGFTGFARSNKIYILRGTKRFNFNYKEVAAGKKMGQDIDLEDGDRIFVPE